MFIFPFLWVPPKLITTVQSKFAAAFTCYYKLLHFQLLMTALVLPIFRSARGRQYTCIGLAYNRGPNELWQFSRQWKMHGNQAEIKLTEIILNVTQQFKRGSLVQRCNVCRGDEPPPPRRHDCVRCDLQRVWLNGSTELKFCELQFMYDLVVLGQQGV